MRIPIATLRVGQQRCVNLGAQSVVVCRTESGVHAFENRCPHAEFPLSGGQIVQDAIRCPTHGAKFDVRTGQPLTNPRLAPLRRFRVEVDGDFAVLSAEEPGNVEAG
jgi:3-phenylpropionate/trans-cinnamate dioxygenase ferredoxin subunit